MQYLDAISKRTEWSLFISKAIHSISQKSKSMPWPVMLKMLKLNSSLKTYKLQELTPQKDVLFIIGEWNAKVGCLETPWVTGKFGLGVQNKPGQRLTVFPRECTDHSKHPHPNNTGDSSTHGHHQMVNTEIRLIIFFVAKDGEALHSQQKQDQELTVAQIMNSLLANSDLYWK